MSSNSIDGNDNKGEHGEPDDDDGVGLGEVHGGRKFEVLGRMRSLGEME